MAISNQQKNRATKKLNVTPQPLKIRGGAPSENVSKSEILQRMLENNALRLVSEEIVDKTGMPVTGVASFTWAEFIDYGFDLTTARYVHISDKHSTRNATAAPGSLWRIVPTGGTGYKRQLVSGPIYCANEAAAPAAADFPGLWIYDAGLGPNGCDRISDGTGYLVKPGSVIHRDAQQSVRFVVPAATFGSATVDDNGGYARLTGAGVHGLTNAVCIGGSGNASIWVTGGTAGLGLAVGFHQIRSFTDGTSALTLETAYGSAGTATTIQAGGADVVLETITLPRLSANSKVTTRVAMFYPSAAGNKNFKLKLGGTALYAPLLGSSGVSNAAEFTFHNRNSVSSQIAGNGYLSQNGLGTSSVAPSTAAIDTSTGTAQITLTYAPAAANEVCGFHAFEVEVS